MVTRLTPPKLCMTFTATLTPQEEKLPYFTQVVSCSLDRKVENTFLVVLNNKVGTKNLDASLRTL